jgi:hypothetical protein
VRLWARETDMCRGCGREAAAFGISLSRRVGVCLTGCVVCVLRIACTAPSVCAASVQGRWNDLSGAFASGGSDVC